MKEVGGVAIDPLVTDTKKAHPFSQCTRPLFFYIFNWNLRRFYSAHHPLLPASLDGAVIDLRLQVFFPFVCSGFVSLHIVRRYWHLFRMMAIENLSASFISFDSTWNFAELFLPYCTSYLSSICRRFEFLAIQISASAGSIIESRDLFILLADVPHWRLD